VELFLGVILRHQCPGTFATLKRYSFIAILCGNLYSFHVFKLLVIFYFTLFLS
jgi:hypothetical protein